MGEGHACMGGKGVGEEGGLGVQEDHAHREEVPY